MIVTRIIILFHMVAFGWPDGRIVMATLCIMAGNTFLIAFGNHQSISKSLLLRFFLCFSNMNFVCLLQINKEKQLNAQVTLFVQFTHIRSF